MSLSSGNGRVGLVVADMQTFHRGHNFLLSEARMVCDRVIVGLGSVNQHGTPGHPFTFEQRKEMIQKIHGDFFEFVPLHDIDGTFHIQEWYSYVQNKILNANLPEPTDYFAGSEIDAKYYFHAFATLDDPSEVRGVTTVYRGVKHHQPWQYKRLHIVNRSAFKLPSGREIRLLIETRDNEWCKYVPERLHDYIELNYPGHLRQAVSYDLDFAHITKMLEGDLVLNGFQQRLPVGTRLSGRIEREVAKRLSDFGIKTVERNGENTVILELKDDGKWRPIRELDEKAEWAKAAKILKENFE